MTLIIKIIWIVCLLGWISIIQSESSSSPSPLPQLPIYYNLILTSSFGSKLEQKGSFLHSVPIPVARIPPLSQIVMLHSYIKTLTSDSDISTIIHSFSDIPQLPFVLIEGADNVKWIERVQMKLYTLGWGSLIIEHKTSITHSELNERITPPEVKELPTISIPAPSSAPDISSSTSPSSPFSSSFPEDPVSSVEEEIPPIPVDESTIPSPPSKDPDQEPSSQNPGIEYFNAFSAVILIVILVLLWWIRVIVKQLKAKRTIQKTKQTPPLVPIVVGSPSTTPTPDAVVLNQRVKVSPSSDTLISRQLNIYDTESDSDSVRRNEPTTYSVV